MTDVTDLGDIFVVGQRRRPGGSFPGGGGSGGGGSTGGPQQNELGEVQPEDPPPGPCDNPETALEWNTDAAAAKAAKEFARQASERTPPETINTREWTCYLYRAANGSVQLGPITWGSPFTSGGVGPVEPDMADIDPSSIVGAVHSHGSGSHLPSDGNAQEPGDIQYLVWLVGITQNPDVRMYIVAQNHGPVGFVPYNQINIYNKATAASARSNFTKGPEVNPDAEPCPS